MKKFFYLAAFLAPVAALTLYSCMKDPEWGKTLEASQLETKEASAFFESYAASLPQELRPAGITPGNFAPEWGKATPAGSGGVAYLNVPIVAEHAYEGYFAKDYTQAPQDGAAYYHTAIAQKLVVAKEEQTGRFACAVATIIPAEDRATKSSSEVQRMFYCGGANAKFSGVVVYSTLEDGGYTLCVDRYQDGKIAAHRDVYSSANISNANAQVMAALLGAAKVFKKAPMRTKCSVGGIFGVNDLAEVVVTAPRHGGDSVYWWPPASSISIGDGGGYYGSGNNSILPNKAVPYTASQYQATGGYKSNKNGNGCDCMCVTLKIMRQKLGDNANVGSNSNRIQLYLENSDGELYKIGDAGNVFNVLNSHIDNGRPIIAGVDHTYNRGINEGTTDHFIVITGRGYDNSRGQYYYNYIETAYGYSNAAIAISNSNRLYYDSSVGTFKTDNKVAYYGRTYTITQIRPNN